MAKKTTRKKTTRKKAATKKTATAKGHPLLGVGIQKVKPEPGRGILQRGEPATAAVCEEVAQAVASGLLMWKTVGVVPFVQDLSVGPELVRS